MRVLIYFRLGQIFEEGLQKIPSNISYKEWASVQANNKKEHGDKTNTNKSFKLRIFLWIQEH